MRRLLLLACCSSLLMAAPLRAQIQTAPLEQMPSNVRAPASAPRATATPTTPAPAATASPDAAEPPPVLPANPLRRALEAAATGGSGGMSYSGPSGAMNTSPEGSSCAVTCALTPQLEQHETSCGKGFTAMCQCDTQPYAGCRRQ